MIRPPATSAGGILYAKDFDEQVVSEGAAEVVAANPLVRIKSTRAEVPHGIQVGDRILFRGFLRFAQALGDLYGAEKSSDIFLLNVTDVLAILEGSGTVGRYDEFRL
jgi:co-chaperonin GroES (HSP10)